MTPKCQYFGKCGGCMFQHVDYKTQVEQKRNAAEHSTKFKAIQVYSGNDYGYRNRMDMVFNPNGIGFRQQGKWHTIVDVEICPISNDRLNQLIKEVRDFFKQPDYFDVERKTGTFRYAVIRTPSNDSSISFVLNSKSSRLKDAVEKIKEFALKTTANNVIVTYVEPDTDNSISSDFFPVKGGTMLKEKFLGKEFTYSAQGFFQNNSEMAEKMQKHVNEILKKYDTKNTNLLDLYGGVGTFGIINSDMFKETIIVEGDANCIQAANENIKLNNAKNTKAICTTDEQIKKLNLPTPLFVIADPPRSGMHQKTIDHLKKSMPEAIIYISCNVDQLNRDLVKFNDYEVKSVAMFDLFPQTPHVEAVVELIKTIKKS